MPLVTLPCNGASGSTATAEPIFYYIGLCSKPSPGYSCEISCTLQVFSSSCGKYKCSDSKSCLLYGSCWSSQLFNSRLSSQRPEYFLHAN